MPESGSGGSGNPGSGRAGSGSRLCAHLGYLYRELPLPARLAAAAADGFGAVEHPAPYEIAPRELRARLDDLGLRFVQLGSGMGDEAAGEKGLAALPGREAEFRDGFARALDYADEVGAGFVHPMAGVAAGLPGAELCYRSNIDWALERLEGRTQRMLVEAITVPGYALPSFEAAIALQEACDQRPRLLFDSFHAAVLGEDGPDWIGRHAHRLGHVHIADHPGRHEPGSGSLDFAALIAALQAAGYAAAIGFEYIPATTTAESLRFLPGWAEMFAPAPATGV